MGCLFLTTKQNSSLFTSPCVKFYRRKLNHVKSDKILIHVVIFFYFSPRWMQTCPRRLLNLLLRLISVKSQKNNEQMGLTRVISGIPFCSVLCTISNQKQNANARININLFIVLLTYTSYFLLTIIDYNETIFWTQYY